MKTCCLTRTEITGNTPPNISSITELSTTPFSSARCKTVLSALITLNMEFKALLGGAACFEGQRLADLEFCRKTWMFSLVSSATDSSGVL